MMEQNHKRKRLSKILNIVLGVLQLFFVVGDALTKDWVKVSDPMANWIHFHIIIPISVGLLISSFYFATTKSGGVFLKYTRVTINAVIIVIIVIFSSTFLENFN